MPEGWSWWFGHLLVLDKKLKKLPPDVNVYMAMEDMIEDHEDTQYFLMDYWPMFQPLLMVFSPEIAAQVSTKHDLSKPKDQLESFQPIVGGPSLITMNDAQWKVWRSLFNTGFSASHMLSLVPSLVDSVDVFCEQLQKHVDDGGIILLDDMAMRLTMDIITKTTLDIDLDNQRSEHKLALALNTILNWHSFWDPRVLLNPLRRPVQWYYGRVMDTFIKGELQKRFEEMKAERATLASDKPKKAKSVIALALEEYLIQQHQSDKQALESIKLDPNFAGIAANQIRMFIFAGNDSTASALVYIYHLLSKNPSALAKLRQEHDEIFSSNANAGNLLRKDPALINQCRYTLAVIKETLRLFPPSSSLRDGVAGISITDGKGNLVPTEGLNVTVMHRYVHIHPRIWPRPLEFLPERWIVGPEHELYPKSVSTAYRPFEHGARNCIAQTLVYNELRVALIMTVRSFNITPAYREWDAMKEANAGSLASLMEKFGFKSKVPNTVLGERAYQTTRPGAHPADRYPCRVSLAE
jgi:cytochrome P450